MAKIYTVNIERKRLLKQRRERTLQNTRGKGLADEYFPTALKTSRKSYKASKNSHKRKKDNNGPINDDKTNIATTKSYHISSEMDIETIPRAMYFSGNKETITKINQVPYQGIDYDDKGMFQAKLMDNTQVEIFIDNGTTPSILPLNMYNKHPILQEYPKTESHTVITQKEA